MTLETGRGRHSKYASYAFTEQGVAMLSAVLHSRRAIETSIIIVRVFVKLREMLVSHKELAHKMEELEQAQKEQADHIANIYQMLEQLWLPLKCRQAAKSVSTATTNSPPVRVDVT